ncbi:MAG TPA: HlyD family type I secretion periplasmic adaptor subunit, partial [Azospirillaceae bacterium]|nr:HlyD family type I secretion periplasmic adaptor subunit [Azospirillaceae bacterium]
EALVRALDTRIAIIQEQIDAIAPLVRQGLERRPRILALQETMAEMDGERAETRAHIARARQTIAESEVSLLAQENDWRNGVAQDLARVQQVVHDLQERLRAAADVLDRTEVRAPEAGVVNDLRVHTVGGVVAPGEALLDLVPKEDRLLVEVQVRPEDIDNLHVGLAAEVSLLPFNHRRVPPVAGQVIYVSADRLSDRATGQPYYVARIRLDEDSLKAAGNLELVPGMPGDAQIHTGETTVALYALSPLLDNFHKAFRAH